MFGRWTPGSRRTRASEAPTAPHADSLARIRSAALAHPAPPVAPGDAATPPRVSAVILSHDRPSQVGRAIRSVLAAEVQAEVIVVDSNSSEPTREILRALAREHPAIDLRLMNRNLGCPGGRRLGIELAGGDYVLLLDDDAELMPRALEHLVADLDAHPEASAVTALVVYHDGTVYHFGGWVEETASSVTFEIHGHGTRFDDPSIAETGPSGWTPATAALIRAEVFDEVPFDVEWEPYFEDNDWCLRLDRARPASQRRCREAIAVHAEQRPAPDGPPFVRRAWAVRRLCGHSRFLAKHGILLDTELTELVPELAGPDGSRDDAAARLLLTLLDARGPAWTLMTWMGGGLAPLLEPAQLDELQDAIGWLSKRDETLARVEAGGWWRLRGHLAPVLAPASRLRRAVKRAGSGQR